MLGLRRCDLQAPDSAFEPNPHAEKLTSTLASIPDKVDAAAAVTILDFGFVIAALLIFSATPPCPACAVCHDHDLLCLLYSPLQYLCQWC